MTDSSREGKDRENIAQAIFSGKISSQALKVLTTAVALRWSQERDLADALEKLRYSHPSHPLSLVVVLMPLKRLPNELLTFVRNVDGTPEAQAALSDNLASKEAKKKLAVALGGPAVTAEGVLLLERIGSESRGHHAARLADEFVEIIVTRQNRYIAR